MNTRALEDKIYFMVFQNILHKDPYTSPYVETTNHFFHSDIGTSVTWVLNTETTASGVKKPLST